MAIFRIEKKNNYTVMSNHHLVNKELSLKAKGLMSYMLTRPDDWDFTLVDLAKRNKECRDTIGDIVKELEKFGYVERHRIRDSKGHFQETEYIVHEEPMRKKPTLDNSALDNPAQENSALLNTEKLNTEIPNTENNNYQSNLIVENEIPSPREEDEKDKIDLNNRSYDYWKQLIHQNIEYESLQVTYAEEIKFIDEIVEIMAEILSSQKQYEYIGGTKHDLNLVKDRFLKIDYSKIQYVVESFNKISKEKEIKNIKQYLKSVIFNAPITIDAYYTAKVNNLMPWIKR